MPTNDERREVAARLREANLTKGASYIERKMGLEPAVAARFVEIPNLIGALNFDKAIVSTRELTNRLADLIEPEPERTCKPVIAEDGANEGSRVCSECGRLYWATPFCAYCGAKVVGE